MRTVVAEHAGFCGGVRRAVAMAESLAAAANGCPVFTDGPLIHNAGETARLAALGVRPCENPAMLPAGAHLVLRAHGIPPSRQELLSTLSLTLHDATCPFVRSVQERCRAEALEGRFVLILGDADHAEVVGLSGYAGPRSSVISGPHEVRGLPEPGSSVSLVSQTTQSPERLSETAAAVRARWPDARVFDTICPATRDRRRGMDELTGKCEAVAVVGSSGTANEMRLLALARERLPAALVESPDTIDEDFFRHFSVVGIAAGASTPDSAVTAVRERLEVLT